MAKFLNEYRERLMIFNLSAETLSETNKVNFLFYALLKTPFLRDILQLRPASPPITLFKQTAENQEPEAAAYEEVQYKQEHKTLISSNKEGTETDEDVQDKIVLKLFNLFNPFYWAGAAITITQRLGTFVDTAIFGTPYDINSEVKGVGFFFTTEK